MTFSDRLLRLVPNLLKHRPDFALVVILLAVIVYLIANRKEPTPPTVPTVVVQIVNNNASDEAKIIRPSGPHKP